MSTKSELPRFCSKIGHMPQANQKPRQQGDSPLTPADLKHFMFKHIEAARILKGKEKNGMVAYHLGYVLEFALKVCICKHLHQVAYPGDKKDKDEGRFFRSHSFTRLFMLSGLQDMFDRGRQYGGLYDSFTQEYPGDDWTKMRYNRKTQKYLSDKRVATRLYKTLVGQGRGAPNSIVGIIKRQSGLW
jgi:hypothetical protein